MGRGIQSDPSWGRIGTLALPPDGVVTAARWAVEFDDQAHYRKGDAEAAEGGLGRAGYSRPGLVEALRQGGGPSAMDGLLRSTQTLQIAYKTDWPPRAFRFSRVHYNRLGTCALLVFQRDSPEDAFRYKLARISPHVRKRRAQAHVTAALELYQKGDLEAAVAEAGIASATDPMLAAARYHHAVLLAASGSPAEAIEELRAAARLDPSLARKARKAVEFDEIRSQEGFRAALGDLR